MLVDTVQLNTVIVCVRDAGRWTRAAASRTAPRGSTSLAASVTCVTTPAPPVWMQDLPAAAAVKMVGVGGMQMVDFLNLRSLVHILLKLIDIVIFWTQKRWYLLSRGAVDSDKCPIFYMNTEPVNQPASMTS